MSDRRNIVEEILEIRGRRKFDIPSRELFLRLLHVEEFRVKPKRNLGSNLDYYNKA